jgi:hypothetical protein
MGEWFTLSIKAGKLHQRHEIIFVEHSIFVMVLMLITFNAVEK